MTARKRPTDRLEDEVLSHLELSRRELVRRLVTGTAFAVPVVASFDMASLTVSSADATTPNQVDFLPPAITSDVTASLTAGEPGAATVTTTGTPSPSISQGGALPPAVTFSDNGDGTATLAGTPAVGTGGAYPLTITATNGHPPDAAQQFTLAVDEPVTITSPLSATLAAGQQGTFMITTGGFPTPMLSLTGALPQGVTFIDNGDGTGTLSGMPAVGAGGTYPLQLTAATETAPPLTHALALTVDQAPAITSPPQASFTTGRPGRFVVTTTGFPVPRISAAGGLPAGVVLTDNGDGTASLAGTPAAGSGGRHALTLSAVGIPGAPATQTFALLVTERPVPVVSIDRPRAGASYRRGEVVKASYRASSPSGISSVHGTVPDGTPVDTARGGRKSFAVTATDSDGFSTTAQIFYAVDEPSNRFALTNLHVLPDGTLTFHVEVPGPGTIEVLVTAWDSNLAANMAAAASLLEPAPGRFVFARAHQQPNHHGTVRLHVPPNGRGRRLVHHHRHEITLRLWVSYTPRGGITRGAGLYGLTLPKTGPGR
jgi:hypothetical protein